MGLKNGPDLWYTIFLPEKNWSYSEGLFVDQESCNTVSMHSIQISAVFDGVCSPLCIQEWATHGVLSSKNNQIDGMSWDVRCLEVSIGQVLKKTFQIFPGNVWQ